MSAYIRPAVPVRVFVDAAGRPIPYGERWGQDGPPEDTYSVTLHPERFAPVHTVADALVTWLREAYAVSVEDSPETASDLIHAWDDVVRSVRITPADRAAAPITVVFTEYPGVRVHAGALADFHFPSCGCDACDETWESSADELEWTVRVVVSGGFAESVDEGRQLGVAFRLDDPGVGSRSGSGGIGDIAPARLAAARAMIPPGGRWSAWPRA